VECEPREGIEEDAGSNSEQYPSGDRRKQRSPESAFGAPTGNPERNNARYETGSDKQQDNGAGRRRNLQGLLAHSLILGLVPNRSGRERAGCSYSVLPG
jgi:hypothetical protein